MGKGLTSGSADHAGGCLVPDGSYNRDSYIRSQMIRVLTLKLVAGVSRTFVYSEFTTLINSINPYLIRSYDWA